MKIMLCGAIDTSSIRTSFEKVVREFGAQPMNFLNATHSYTNSMTTTSEKNSRASVQDADICVFVLKNNYGAITWSIEFQEALRDGKPFIILCDDDTLRDYYTFKNRNICPDDFQIIYNTLKVIENDRELTICPFIETAFEITLRGQLAKLMENAIRQYTVYKQRETAIFLLCRNQVLTKRDINDLKEIVTDEYEPKKIRKDIIIRLSELHCLDKETIIDLIGSPEQGVSRITLDNLDQLMPPEDYTYPFLCECVTAVNQIDDVGARRRLINKILDIDVKNGIKALQEMDLEEVGSKRRLSAALIEHKEEIVALGLQDIALVLAEQCRKKASNDGWRDECKKFINEMKA